MTEDQMYNMSDEELESLFHEAKSSATEEVTVETDVVDEIDEAEYMEQPGEDEDSDNDASMEDDEGEEAEEASDETEEAATEDVEEESESAENVDTADKTKETEVQPTAKYSFKANGREYQFTEEEVKAQFPKIFGQAMDYTKKMQAIKPWRKTIDAIEQAQLDHESVNLMIDVLKGDKEAIAEVLRRTGTDALELDVDNGKYVAKDYGRDDATLALKDVIEEISSDKEYEVTQRILGKEWDSESWNEISSKPEMIKLLHVDVKTGMYDTIQPVAEKLKLYDRGRKSDLDYYAEASKLYFEEQEQARASKRIAEESQAVRESEAAKQSRLAAVESERAKVVKVKEEAGKRKAAAPVKKAAGVKKVVDYLDDSDEAFEEWYKTVQDKM